MFSQSHSTVSKDGDLFLWRTGNLADIKISCRGTYMLLHRSILAARCPWFKEKIEGLLMKGGSYEIQLHEFPPPLVRTLLYFIYSSEIDNDRLHPEKLKFDHAVFATLYDMSIHFKFTVFKEALLSMFSDYVNVGIDYFHRGPRAKFTHSQIDGILAGVRVAYGGDDVEQAPLRRLYVRLFTECYKKIRKNAYFYEAIRAVPMFGVDLLESVGLKSWEEPNPVENKAGGTKPAETKHAKKPKKQLKK